MVEARGILETIMISSMMLILKIIKQLASFLRSIKGLMQVSKSYSLVLTP